MTPEEIAKTIEKELVSWRHDHFKGMRDGDHSGEYLERGSQIELANYFYDLGCRHTAVMYDDIEFERQARKTWKGVDVDKCMDEMRGREQEQPDAKLDDSIVNEWSSHFSPEIRDSIKSTAYHFWNMANGVKNSKLDAVIVEK